MLLRELRALRGDPCLRVGPKDFFQIAFSLRIVSA
jgi:hypothetical protein